MIDYIKIGNKICKLFSHIFKRYLVPGAVLNKKPTRKQFRSSLRSNKAPGIMFTLKIKQEMHSEPPKSYFQRTQILRKS